MPTFVELSAKLTADAADFNRQLATAKKSVDDLGNAIKQQAAVDKANAERAANLRRQSEAYQALGGAINRYVTLPLTLAGGAAIKMGADVETSLSRLVGLAGVPAGEIDGIRKSLEGVSRTTATSLPQLIQGFYTVASVGFKGAEGIDLVTRSAKASAAGMGDVQTIAKLVSAAVNSYGRENLTAAQATDALTAAVKVGGAEATELGATLGNALSATKAAGVSFQDLAAGVAALTAAGADTDQAVTGIRNVFAQLIDASPEARKELKSLGLDIGTLKETITSKGLLEGLFQLKGIIGGNTEAFAKIFPDIRGLVQVLNLLGQSPQAAIDAFDQVRNSTGALDKAFQAFKDTAASKLKQALVDSQSELIKLGDTLIPLAADVLPKIVGALKTAVDLFDALPGPVKTAAVGLAAIAAASGPILTLVGNLKRARAALTGPEGVVGGVGLFKTALGGIVVTAGMLAVQKWFSDQARRRNEIAAAIGDVATAAGSDLKAQIAQLTELKAAIKEGIFGATPETLKSHGFNPSDLKIISDSQGRKVLPELDKQLSALRLQLKGQEADAARAGDALKGLGDNAQQGATGVDALTASLDALDKQAAFADALDKLREVGKVDPFAIAAQSAITLKQAQLQLADAQDHYNGLLNQNVGLEQKRFEIEQRRAAATLATAKVQADKARDELDRLTSSGAGTPRQIEEARARLGEALVGIDEAQQGVNEAQKAGTNAARELERASLDVQSAQLAVRDAQANLTTVAQETAKKQRDLEAAFRDVVRLGSDPAVISADEFKKKLIELRDTFPTLAGPINDVITALGGIASAAAAAFPTGPSPADYAIANHTPTLTPEAVAYIKGISGETAPQTASFNAPQTTEAGGSTVDNSINVNIGTITNPDPTQVVDQIDQKLRTYRLVGGSVQ